jgi:hypothetical protein
MNFQGKPIFKNFLSKIENSDYFTKTLQKVNLSYKQNIRKFFGPIYFKLRYLNLTNIDTNGQVYKNSLDHYINNTSSLFFSETKIQELFEYSEKSKFLSASLLEIDVSELATVDSYKENYPYTVKQNINLGSIRQVSKDNNTERTLYSR